MMLRAEIIDFILTASSTVFSDNGPGILAFVNGGLFVSKSVVSLSKTNIRNESQNFS